MERTSISYLSTTNPKRSYLRVIASSNLCPSSLCFGICWYPSVCWHLKLHIVCSLVETNCHTTLSVKRASSAALDPNRTNQETDEVGLALLTGRTTFWHQRFHAIGCCTLQSFVTCKSPIWRSYMLTTPVSWRSSKTIKRTQAMARMSNTNWRIALSVLNCDNVNEAWQVLHNCFVWHK